MYKLFGVVYTMERGAKMQAAMMKGSIPMEMKKISISEKRQITIPQKFFTMLGFDTEAECYHYAMSKALEMKQKNECLSNLEFIAC